MTNLSVLCAFNTTSYAFQKLENGATAFELSCRSANDFFDCKKILVLCLEKDKKNLELEIKNILIADKVEYQIISLENINAYSVFLEVSNFLKSNSDFQNVFFLYADTPFIDLNLTKELYEQHIEYKAEYSFVDGYPEGFAPQILASGLCPILMEVAKQSVSEKDASNQDSIFNSRSFIFDTIKKEINNYDIETLIAPEDFRHLRLNFVCDNKRNTQLCNNFIGINGTNYAKMIEEKQTALFTLPAYYSIEINSSIPFNSIYNPKIEFQKEKIDKQDFFQLIEKIAKFSDDAMISLSVFGEPALHNDIDLFVEKILSYPKLSVLIETTGINWSNEKIEKIKKIVEQAQSRRNQFLPIYWIVKLDAVSSSMYSIVHNLNSEEANQKLKEAVSFTDKINKNFENSVWTQIVRMNENEIEVEPFYRFWKDLSVQVIIQKFDHFCNAMQDKRVADLSPFYRHPCWHIKRDLCILSDGRVPMCREDFSCKNILGNALQDSLEAIREKAFKIYSNHLSCNYGGLCKNCDEYYTYNF